MAWRPAPAVKAALDQANALWPSRSKVSDGTVSSAEHRQQNPNSDHDPDSRGVVLAFDLTNDPAHGVDCHKLSAQLVARRDRRVKYIIWNRRIWNPSVSPDWRPYSGSNPHTKHMHVSVLQAHENDTSPWWRPEEDVMTPEQEQTILDKIADVRGAAHYIATALEERTAALDADLEEIKAKLAAASSSGIDYEVLAAKVVDEYIARLTS